MKHFICMLIVLVMLIPAACAAALLSEEETIQLAKEKYLKSAQKMGWPLLDLDAYDTEYRKMKTLTAQRHGMFVFFLRNMTCRLPK